MAILFQDDFNRANSSSLGDNWVEIGDWEIDTNRAQCITEGLTSGQMRCVGHAVVADVKVSVAQTNAAGDGGPVARWDGVELDTNNANTGRAYAVDMYPTNTCEIHRYDVGVDLVLLRTSTVTQVANGTIRIEVTGSGATVTVKQLYNGVQYGADVSDGDANRITDAGFTGMHSFLNNGTAGGVADYDDFLVEDFAAPELVEQDLMSVGQRMV